MIWHHSISHHHYSLGNIFKIWISNNKALIGNNCNNSPVTITCTNHTQTNDILIPTRIYMCTTRCSVKRLFLFHKIIPMECRQKHIYNAKNKAKTNSQLQIKLVQPSRWNRCQDVNSFPIGRDHWGALVPHRFNIIQQDVKSNNLSLNGAIDMAQNRPLWRLMSISALCTPSGGCQNRWWLWIISTVKLNFCTFDRQIMTHKHHI